MVLKKLIKMGGVLLGLKVLNKGKIHSQEVILQSTDDIRRDWLNKLYFKTAVLSAREKAYKIHSIDIDNIIIMNRYKAKINSMNEKEKQIRFDFLRSNLTTIEKVCDTKIAKQIKIELGLLMKYFLEQNEILLHEVRKK